MNKCTLLIFFAFVFLGSKSFASNDISIKAEVDRAFITIGDRINFRLTITHDPKIQVTQLDAADALRDFEVKEVKDFSSKEQETVAEGKTYVITNYQLGDYVIRPIQVRYHGPDGEVHLIKSNRLYITVHSIEENKPKDSKNDIRGIKGVLPLKSPAWPWLVALLAVSIITTIAIWHHLSRKKRVATALSQTLLSPHDEAYQGLYQLQHSDFLRRGEFKLYFLKMSEVIRRYLERRFQIPALELTTSEVHVIIKGKIGSGELALLDETLLFCDLVKFAKYIPSVQEVLAQNKQAIAVIDRTKLEELAQPSATAVQPEGPKQNAF